MPATKGIVRDQSGVMGPVVATEGSLWSRGRAGDFTSDPVLARGSPGLAPAGFRPRVPAAIDLPRRS
ncbi:MAG: hypothetical protein AVDCRST_MAG70-245 [uncultured Thermomicrobiales bacterium]|uniref:Uncharacterized protein n=1 Tax=uncultured Thermomicrobiales bacterium TaxID=1645740 RepID=A0A6J4U6Y6_9BACT|nr:MAG: hypothetical protein AVDCRST_MAG70-245 [uncultured Thermomicrobiales bacterium]